MTKQKAKKKEAKKKKTVEEYITIIPDELQPNVPIKKLILSKNYFELEVVEGNVLTYKQTKLINDFIREMNIHTIR